MHYETLRVRQNITNLCIEAIKGSLFELQATIDNRLSNTENNKVLSLASDSGDEIEVKEMFRSNELRQLWKVGTPNEEGYFIITEALSEKVLVGNGDDLKIDGKLVIESY